MFAQNRTMRHAAIALATLILVTIFSNSATSQMGQAVDHFVPSEGDQLAQVMSVERLRPLANQKDVRIRWTSISFRSTGVFYMFRFEDRECTEICPTAFFLNDITDAKLAGIAFLPPKYSANDYLPQMCDRCGHVQSFYFVSSKSDRAGVVAYWNGVLIFGSQ